MKVSIIITTSNHCEDYLKPCLESINKNTDLTNVEIIVVANGCRDNTGEYLAKNGFIYGYGSPLDQKTKEVWFDESIGYTKACNAGIKLSRGEYILLLNDDTVILDKSWLDILLKPFAEVYNCGITGPVKFDWDCGGVKRTAIGFWCAMIRRSLLEELAIYEEIEDTNAVM